MKKNTILYLLFLCIIAVALIFVYHDKLPYERSVDTEVSFKEQVSRTVDKAALLGFKCGGDIYQDCLKEWCDSNNVEVNYEEVDSIFLEYVIYFENTFKK